MGRAEHHAQVRGKENIKHCRHQLTTEIDPKKRALLQKNLVAEEDRLGATDELIADVKREIAAIKDLIAERRALIATLERDHTDSVKQIKLVLGALEQTQALHKEYYRTLQVEFYAKLR